MQEKEVISTLQNQLNYTEKNISDINEMLGKGQIKPLISKEIPMENAVEAIKLIGSRGVVGKVVLVN